MTEETAASVEDRIRQLAAALPASDTTPTATRLWQAIAEESANQNVGAVAARIRALVALLGDEEMTRAAQMRWRQLADSIARIEQ